MPTLVFMPWCRIEKEYRVGNITVIPFKVFEKPGILDALGTCQARALLSPYKNLRGESINEAALIRYSEKEILSDLTNDEVEDIRDCLDLFCFSALARREYLCGAGSYCNADRFTFFGKTFKNDVFFSTFISRRRDGRTVDVRPLSWTSISIPIHVSESGRIDIDEVLLSALIDYRETDPNGDWPRWRNAISCFNQANTDNDAVRQQVEWVLLCCAFQTVLGAKSKDKDVASKFEQAMLPTTSLQMGSAARKPASARKNSSIRYEWMKEFYRVRGDYAHGKMDTAQCLTWQTGEHIVLATIAFPLVVRCLLSRAGKYTLGDQDQAEVDAFEGFTQIKFLEPLANQTTNMDSPWRRLVNDAWKELLDRKMEMLADGTAEQG
ncbi:MAG: hypothetical protein AB1696_28550 [Planctomycetota bacterium]